jgi:hypothetical protein
MGEFIPRRYKQDLDACCNRSLVGLSGNPQYGRLPKSYASNGALLDLSTE